MALRSSRESYPATAAGAITPPGARRPTSLFGGRRFLAAAAACGEATGPDSLQLGACRASLSGTLGNEVRDSASFNSGTLSNPDSLAGREVWTLVLRSPAANLEFRLVSGGSEPEERSVAATGMFRAQR